MKSATSSVGWARRGWPTMLYTSHPDEKVRMNTSAIAPLIGTGNYGPVEGSRYRRSTCDHRNGDARGSGGSDFFGLLAAARRR